MTPWFVHYKNSVVIIKDVFFKTTFDICQNFCENWQGTIGTHCCTLCFLKTVLSATCILRDRSIVFIKRVYNEGYSFHEVSCIYFFFVIMCICLEDTKAQLTVRSAVTWFSYSWPSPSLLSSPTRRESGNGNTICSRTAATTRRRRTCQTQFSR